MSVAKAVFSAEEHQGGGTQIINKVAVTDGVASARGGCLGCCWDERFSNIKSDQKQFLNGLGGACRRVPRTCADSLIVMNAGAIHSTASPLMLFDDEYIV